MRKQNLAELIEGLLQELRVLRADNAQLMMEKIELLQGMLALQEANAVLHRQNTVLLSRGAKKPSSINPNSFSSAPARKSPSPQSPISPEKYARLCSRGKK